MRSPAKGVSGLKPGSRVQIPPSPPFFLINSVNKVVCMCVSIAQLDRASDYGSEGCEFDSCWVRHFFILSLYL